MLVMSPVWRKLGQSGNWLQQHCQRPHESYYTISMRMRHSDIIILSEKGRVSVGSVVHEPRLLSSLVWIASGVVVSQHRLESFFHEITCNGMTSSVEFMLKSYLLPCLYLSSRSTAFGNQYLHIGSHSMSSCTYIEDCAQYLRQTKK